MKVKHVIKADGPLHIEPGDTDEEVINKCGRHLDNAYSHEILGETLFEGDDGCMYVVTVEAVISPANPDYVREAMDDLEEEDQ